MIYCFFCVVVWFVMVVVVVFVLFGMMVFVDVGMLIINIVFKGVSQCVVWQLMIEVFYKVYFDIDVKLIFVDEEVYKVQFLVWFIIVVLDVVNWYVGEWMVYYVKCGLFEDLSGDWMKNGWDVMYVLMCSVLFYNGKQYVVLIVYYLWGLFYCKDLFCKVGIVDELKMWDQFFDVCKKLKVVGIMLIVIGGCDVWMFVGWFDYFDLCLNGNVFYQ